MTGKRKAMPILPNDTVLHKPTGETWVVAGVNYETGELVPCGYPFPSVAKIADCELKEKEYEGKYQDPDIVKYFLENGMQNFVDVTSAMYLGLI